MHAVVTTVNIAAGEFENARKSLHETVVPRVSKAPGFVRGVWRHIDDPVQHEIGRGKRRAADAQQSDATGRDAEQRRNSRGHCGGVIRKVHEVHQGPRAEW